MSIVNEANREELLENPNVASLTDKHIIYTDQFKLKAIHSIEDGCSASSVWQKAGFDLSYFKSNYFGKCIVRWKAQLVDGAFVLQKRGRHIDVILTKDEEIAFLRAENAILKEFRALGVQGKIQSTGLSLELYRQIVDSHLPDSVNWRELAKQAITSGWPGLLES